MQTIKEMIQQIQTIIYDAYKASGQAAALLGELPVPSVNEFGCLLIELNTLLSH